MAEIDDRLQRPFACLRRWLTSVWITAALTFFGGAYPMTADAGRIIYVSPTRGDDANSGTRDLPLGSVSAAISVVRPGDTILLEPGRYRQAGASGFGLRIRRSGTKAAPIILRAQSGEAIIDCSEMRSTKTVYCVQLEADWWQISGIAVTGSRQNAKGAWAVGINLLNARNNVLRSVRSFRNEGPGIVITGNSGNNRLQDCKAFANYDPLSAIPGGNADGIQITAIPQGQVGNVISNCRSFDNSDDGFDLWKAESLVTIKNSVASRNGYVPGSSRSAGDGVGFKLGKNLTGPRHRIINNLAVDNRAAGFDRNGGVGQLTFIDNVARGNGGDSFN